MVLSTSIKNWEGEGRIFHMILEYTIAHGQGTKKLEGNVIA